MIESKRFRNLLRRACIKIMNAIDTGKGRAAIRQLAPDELTRDWADRLSDHIIEADVAVDVSDEQAAACLDAITKVRARVDDLGPTGFPKKFMDLFKGPKTIPQLLRNHVPSPARKASRQPANATYRAEIIAVPRAQHEKVDDALRLRG
eukprot:jgi/Tetstr1/435109/TSEL_024077.t1